MSAQTATPRVVTRGFRSMASPVTLTVVDPGPGAESALDRAEAVIRDVAATCTRFDLQSPLSRLNAAPGLWHEVPATLGRAVQEARLAHTWTGGLFDPRVLDVLLAWGYDRTLPFTAGYEHDGAASGSGPAPSAAPAAAPEPWCPRMVEGGETWRVHLDGEPIDLGGIGKGLAVRWAAAELADAGGGAMVDAGGDCDFLGVGPEGGPWRVAVEDPAGGAEPVLVVELTDTGCATSSTRLRRWRSGGQQVHHLIDPRTRRPGGEGLASVTVLAPDAAEAEVWTKALFLAGAQGVRRRAEALCLAAAWVDVDGAVGSTAGFDAHVIWRRHHG